MDLTRHIYRLACGGYTQLPPNAPMPQVLPADCRSVLARMSGTFAQLYGSDRGTRAFFAPGRVNLIGAHLDYSGGLVLPTAVDRGVFVLARARSDRRVRLASLDQGLRGETEIGRQRPEPEHGWTNYPRGILHLLPGDPSRYVGLDLLYCGTAPMGGGLSSSAAIEVVTAITVCAMASVDLSSREIADLAYRSETEFVGVRCGIMDQFASALARPEHALLIDCCHGSMRHLPLPADQVEIVMLDTRKPRYLVGSEFNLRVEQCREAFAILQPFVDARCLAHVTRSDLVRHQARLSALLARRAEHVVFEMERVRAAATALEQHDFAAMGRLVHESHISTRDRYEVSCAELDHLVEDVIGRPGVHGARLTGAGFGGCAMALTVPGAVDRWGDDVVQSYEARFGWAPRVLRLHAGGGARELPRE